MAQHPLHHLLQVAFALAQVFVIHLVKLAAQQLQLRRQRPFGVVQALGDQLAHARGKHVVLHQHQVHIQQGRQLLRGIQPQITAQVLQFFDDSQTPFAHTLDLALNLLGFDQVMGHIQMAGRRHHCPTNGNAPGHCDSVNGKCHAGFPLSGSALMPLGNGPIYTPAQARFTKQTT